MTAADLNAELRNLIDERLDAIDHVLTRAQMTWSERRSIVGEVETQIFELLARRSEFPMEEDVLAVLESLDPPEAYLPEELRSEFADAPVAAGSPQPKVRAWPRRAFRVAARLVPAALCVASLAAVNWVVVVLIAMSDGIFPWIVTICVLVCLNYEGIRRLRAWSARRQGNLVVDLCQSAGAWLMSKSGAQAT